MTFKLIRRAGALLVLAGAAAAQPAADRTGCQARVDKVAQAAGVPSTPVTEGHFLAQVDKVAALDARCDGALDVWPDPDRWAERPSPLYPSLVVRVVGAAFDLAPAEVTRAIAACLKAAKPDPPAHSGRAGFTRQRWLNSQMTGNTEIGGLTWGCTYHNEDTRAASVSIAKAR